MRNAFLGSNTPNGFFSYYGSILEMGGGARLFILKGGSGTGKSTLMKRVIQFADSVGLTTEAYHCSSDVDSLDGVLVPELSVAVVDGTSPHVVDATAYGAFEEIVDLGEAVDRAKVAPRVEDVKELIRRKASCYKSAYAYIGGAGKLYEDTAEKYRAVTDPVKVNAMGLSVTGELGLKRRDTARYGRTRRLFAAALTPSGYCDYTAELLEAPRVIVLKNGFNSVAADVLERVADIAALYGYDMELYCDPIAAHRPLALYVKELKTAVVSKSFLSDVPLSADLELDLDTCVDGARLPRELVRQNGNEAMILLTFGYERMGRAAGYHRELEKIYKPAVDFTVVNGKLDYILSEMQKI